MKKENKNMLSRLILLSCLILSFTVIVVNAQPTQKQIERAKKFSTDGNELFNRGKYREAIEKYSQATSLVPELPAVNFNKASAHLKLGEFDQSLTFFSLALNQGYNPLDVYKARWFVYYQQKQIDFAERDLNEALKIAPNDEYANVALGDVYRAKKDFKAALDSYLKASKLGSKNTELNYFTAVCYTELGDFATAGSYANKALIDKTKYQAESYLMLARQLRGERSKNGEALIQYQRAVGLKPNLLDAHVEMAQLYKIENNFGEGIRSLQRALEIDPKNANTFVDLSWLYSFSDKHVEATTAAERAIQLDPTNSMAYTNLCRANNDLKKFDDAVKSCNSALKLKPNDGESSLYLANAYSGLKKDTAASGLYQKAVTGLISFTKDNPDYADGFYLLGNAYANTRQDAKAIGAYLKALQLAPKFAKARYNLGFIYSENNKQKEAREQYNALMVIDKALAAKLLKNLK